MISIASCDYNVNNVKLLVKLLVKLQVRKTTSKISNVPQQAHFTQYHHGGLFCEAKKSAKMWHGLILWYGGGRWRGEPCHLGPYTTIQFFRQWRPEMWQGPAGA